MYILKSFPVILVLLALSADAEETNAYQGTWRAEMESQKGSAVEGTVVIKDQGGTWDVLVRAKGNPCVGRAVPISIQRASADELVFEINRSQALAGCKDGLASLKRTDERTLEGEFDDGRKLKLVRQ